MLFSEAAETFYLSMETIKADSTVKWYRKQITPLIIYLGDPDLSAVTLEDLERYRATFNRQSDAPGRSGRKVSPYTVHGWVRCIRRFFGQMKKRKIITQNPAEDLEKPKLPKQPRKGIDDEAAIKIIQAAQLTNRRDYALILFVAETGCRVGGAATLKTCNIDLENYRAIVTEKGNKSRSVFFGPDTAAAISIYLQWRDNPDNHPELFLTWDSRPLTPHGIYQIFRRQARKANVPHNWNPHNWRHAAIRSWLKSGMNLKTASELAGHSSESITGDIYGTLSDLELQEAFTTYGRTFNL